MHLGQAIASRHGVGEDLARSTARDGTVLNICILATTKADQAPIYALALRWPMIVQSLQPDAQIRVCLLAFAWPCSNSVVIAVIDCSTYGSIIAKCVSIYMAAKAQYGVGPDPVRAMRDMQNLRLFPAVFAMPAEQAAEIGPSYGKVGVHVMEAAGQLLDSWQPQVRCWQLPIISLGNHSERWNAGWIAE